MKRLATQAALHLGARVLSALLSFTLFAWVGKVLSPNDSVHAFQFLFVLGFAIATARACLHLSARVDGMTRSGQRLRRLKVGFSSLMWLLLPLGCLVFLSVWLNTRNLVLAVLALMIFVPAAFDADAVRSVLRRPSFFALAFSVGSGLAVVALVWVLPHTLNGAVLSFLIQWLPVCLLNGALLSRHLRLLTFQPARIAELAKVLLAASFDGIVLNAPFFGLIILQTQVALDISLVIRIFVAALPLLPLLMHWSNSPDFPLLCKRAGVSTQVGFSLALMVSGLVFGIGFAAFYHYTNQSELNPIAIVAFTIILFTFSIYFSQARFSEALLKSASTLLLLLSTLGAYLGILTILGSEATVLLLAVLQGTTFLLASYMMSHLAQKHSAPPKS